MLSQRRAEEFIPPASCLFGLEGRYTPAKKFSGVCEYSLQLAFLCHSNSLSRLDIAAITLQRAWDIEADALQKVIKMLPRGECVLKNLYRAKCTTWYYATDAASVRSLMPKLKLFHTCIKFPSPINYNFFLTFLLNLHLLWIYLHCQWNDDRWNAKTVIIYPINIFFFFLDFS